MPPVLPEPAQRRSQTEGLLGLGLMVLDRPSKGCAEVVKLRLEADHPHSLRCTPPPQGWLRLLRQHQVMCSMLAPEGVTLPARGRPLERVLPDRLQHHK